MKNMCDVNFIPSLRKIILLLQNHCLKRLPVKIKKLDNFNQFRKEVKSMLLNNSCYTLEEFLQAKLV